MSLLVLLGLAFASPNAYASKGYEKVTSTFGGPCKSSPCPGGQFKEPTSVAVNDETGDVYVLDSGDDRVEWFNSTGSKFEGEFNGSKTPAGKFLNPGGIAIDNDPLSPSHGYVYVADRGNEVVDKFTAAGKYEGQFTGTCTVEGESPPGCGTFFPFGELMDVTVDSTGDLWVFEGNGPVSEGAAYAQADELSDTGSAIETRLLTRSARDAIPGFAVNTDDVIYDTQSENVYEFAKGIEEHVITSDENDQMPLATISSSNDLLVDKGSIIDLFKSPVAPGLPYRTFPSEGLAESAGIAVNGAKGEGPIYATQRKADDVVVFEAGEAGSPEIASESASTMGTAEEPVEQFAAIIEPGNRTTTYSFEYAGSEAAVLNEEGTKVPGETALLAEFGDQTAISPTVELSALHTTYYRVVAENEESKGKPTVGKVQAYTKLPLLAGEKVADLTSTSVTLEATINPVFKPTTYAFEYSTSRQQLEEGNGAVIHGTTGFYQREKLAELQTLEEELKKQEEKGMVPPGTVPICPGIAEQGGTGELPEANKPCPISAELSFLQPGQTYYYRLVSENEVTKFENNANKGKPIVSAVIKEFTPYAPPAVTTGEAQNITGTGATLSGVVNSEGPEATYYFAYIDKAGYEAATEGDAQEKANPYAEGGTTATLSLAASGSPQAVGPIPASDLLPGQTYHYALVAVNRFGLQTIGEDRTLTTLPPAPPYAATGTATSISQTTATLTGTIATNGLQTSYSFEIGTVPGVYGSPTGLGSIGGVATEEVSATVTGLQAGTTYYYRLKATNNDGTVYGQQEAFATASLPYLLTVPASPTLAFPANDLPKVERTNGTGSKPLTNKQKLDKALKACRKEKKKRKRQKCEKTARSKYKVAAKKRARK